MVIRKKMTNDDNPIKDEEALPFEREITNSEFEKFRVEGFLKETEIYNGKKLLEENSAPIRESYSLFGYRIVDSDFKDAIKAEVEIIQSKFNFADINISISDGKTFNFSKIPISKQKVLEDVKGDTEYSFSINSGKNGLFMTMTAEKDRIVISLNFDYTDAGVIRLGELSLRAQVQTHFIRYKIHGYVERRNLGMNTKKTQYIQKIYTSLELPDEKLSVIEKNKIWKEKDQKYNIEGKREIEHFIPDINLANLSKPEILEILNKDQKKLMDLLKENLELKYKIEKTEIIQDKIISTYLPKEGLIELWKNTRKKLNRVLMENKNLPYTIKHKERRIERLKEKKEEIKNYKNMWLDELKD